MQALTAAQIRKVQHLLSRANRHLVAPRTEPPSRASRASTRRRGWSESPSGAEPLIRPAYHGDGRSGSRDAPAVPAPPPAGILPIWRRPSEAVTKSGVDALRERGESLEQMHAHFVRERLARVHGLRPSARTSGMLGRPKLDLRT